MALVMFGGAGAGAAVHVLSIYSFLIGSITACILGLGLKRDRNVRR